MHVGGRQEWEHLGGQRRKEGKAMLMAKLASSVTLGGVLVSAAKSGKDSALMEVAGCAS